MFGFHSSSAKQETVLTVQLQILTVQLQINCTAIIQSQSRNISKYIIIRIIIREFIPGQMKFLKINILEAVDVFEQKEKEKTGLPTSKERNKYNCLPEFLRF